MQNVCVWVACREAHTKATKVVNLKIITVTRDSQSAPRARITSIHGACFLYAHRLSRLKAQFRTDLTETLQRISSRDRPTYLCHRLGARTLGPTRLCAGRHLQPSSLHLFSLDILQLSSLRGFLFKRVHSCFLLAQCKVLCCGSWGPFYRHLSCTLEMSLHGANSLYFTDLPTN